MWKSQKKKNQKKSSFKQFCFFKSILLSGITKFHCQRIVEVLGQDLFRSRRGIALPRQAEKEKQKGKAFSETNFQK